MNAVDIEEAKSDLVTQPFYPAEFPFQFNTAFGTKKVTVVHAIDATVAHLDG